jgi:hypothetical protein
MKNLKHLPVVFDAKAVKDSGEFEGYASTFGNVDKGFDVVMPGAFTKSLQERPAGQVKMLWQHDTTKPIGVLTSAAEDGKGLYVKGQILTSIQQGAEAYALMKAGCIDSMSIGYKTMEADFTSGGVRQLKELGLFEVSLVTFAMNEQANVTTVKDFNPRELEAGLRDAGLSRADAVKAVAFFKNLHRDDEETLETGPRDADRAAKEAEIAANELRKLTEFLRA